MDEGERLRYEPTSVMALSEEQQQSLLKTMRPLTVEDARSEKNVTLEEIWKASPNGVLFVWLRHFG